MSMEETARELFDFIDRHLCAAHQKGERCPRARLGGPCEEACTENIEAILAFGRAAHAEGAREMREKAAEECDAVAFEARTFGHIPADPFDAVKYGAETCADAIRAIKVSP